VRITADEITKAKYDEYIKKQEDAKKKPVVKAARVANSVEAPVEDAVKASSPPTSDKAKWREAPA